MQRDPLIETKKVKKHFQIKRGTTLKAVEDVSFTIYQGEKFGVVGESGCGKSTLGRVILQLYKQTSGATVYYGKPIEELNPKYVSKEIAHLKTYQKKAQEAYKKAVEIDKKIEELKASGAGKEQIEKHVFESKEAKKEASRQLREGSRTVGSLILIKDLDRVAALFEKSQKAAEKVHEEIEIIKKKKEALANCRSEIYERQELEALLKQKISDKQRKKAERRLSRLKKTPQQIEEQSAALQKEIAQHEENAEQYRQQAQGYRREAFAMRGKEVLPITERTLDKEYQDKLDRNYENGINLAKLMPHEMRIMRRDMQMIFQDPAASLDPRQTIGDAIAEVFAINTDYSPAVRREKAMELLEKVGLKREHYTSYPNALSGGQKQRVGIARAIAMDTRFVVLDEAVSALDVSVQAQILQLLEKLSKEKQLTYFFITHDLGVVKHFCDRIMVMYLGNVCELAESRELFSDTLHPYTRSLLASVPRARLHKHGEQEQVLQGEVPSALHPPKGCPFHTRCTQCMEICRQEKPVYHEAKPGHFVACHLYDVKEVEDEF